MQAPREAKVLPTGMSDQAHLIQKGESAVTGSKCQHDQVQKMMLICLKPAIFLATGNHSSR